MKSLSEKTRSAAAEDGCSSATWQAALDQFTRSMACLHYVSGSMFVPTSAALVIKWEAPVLNHQKKQD